jgi:sugar O-acyltransferase (sialic acid O-acetyltransferase NeuD family)
MILYGASGHAKVIIEILEQQGLSVTALIDINPNVKTLLGYPVYPSLNDAAIDANDEVIIAIGNNIVREKLAAEISRNFGTAIHPSATLSSRCQVGAGTVVMAGAAVNSSANIGTHVILNTNCVIDHDCVIGNYAHVSPNAALAGNVTVGQGTHIGIGACVIQGIKIGNWVTIGAGAVVINDVPDHAVVVGNPAKIIKYNK